MTIKNSMQLHEVAKIVVRGTNWLGDAVMSMPALDRLRNSFPSSQITLLAPPRSSEILTGHRAVDRIVPYLRKEQGTKAFYETLRFMRQERFDIAILFQNAFEAGLLAFLGGARIRVGYDTQGRGLLLNHPVVAPLKPSNRHETYAYLDLIAEAERAVLGLTPGASQSNVPVIELQTAWQEEARSLLAGLKLPPARRSIAINAGATNSRAKCWPVARFAELADRLISEFDSNIILIGAPSERDSAEQLRRLTKQPERVANLAGLTSIVQMAGVLSICELLVTNDTGPAHVSAAMGTPTLTIFGPTNEYETAPLGKRSSIIRAEDIECARCMHRDCPIDHRCMTRIEVEAVFQRVLPLLSL